VPFGLAIFLRLIVMPLDRIIHAYAKPYDLGREKDERKPISQEASDISSVSILLFGIGYPQG